MPSAPTAAALVLLLLASAAAAQTATPERSAKERLSDKASDEQRVDNCRVPLDRRGAKPRPDCPPAAATATADPPRR